MNTTKFSNILLDKSPKKINNITEKVLDILFSINEVVRELNSIDFCNPLGYILTKALPPDGLVDKLLKKYDILRLKSSLKNGSYKNYIIEVPKKYNEKPSKDDYTRILYYLSIDGYIPHIDTLEIKSK